jgi:hypothetical protein
LLQVRWAGARGCRETGVVLAPKLSAGLTMHRLAELIQPPETH